MKKRGPAKAAGRGLQLRRLPLGIEQLERRTMMDAALGVALEAGEGEAMSGDIVPDFALIDINPTSASVEQTVSPQNYLGQATAWYFGHST